jgi:hypothetical protein
MLQVNTARHPKCPRPPNFAAFRPSSLDIIFRTTSDMVTLNNTFSSLKVLRNGRAPVDEFHGDFQLHCCRCIKRHFMRSLDDFHIMSNNTALPPNTPKSAAPSIQFTPNPTLNRGRSRKSFQSRIANQLGPRFVLVATFEDYGRERYSLRMTSGYAIRLRDCRRDRDLLRNEADVWRF